VGVLAFIAAIPAAILPFRHWHRLPSRFPMLSAAVASGVLTFFLGAAIGVPGFLEHTARAASAANTAMLEVAGRQVAEGLAPGDPREVNQRFATGLTVLSVFTFLLLTPKGWLTMYLSGTGALRLAAAWFDDPVGDPILTGLDEIAWRTRRRLSSTRDRQSREAREGPEIPDRVVSSSAAGIPACDLVIVTSRRKEGWERGVAVFTSSACYRIGDPVERMVTGRLRTLYPLTEHKDFEAVRKSVRYDLPGENDGSTVT